MTNVTRPTPPAPAEMIKWLDECAEYFEKRPTNGEDKAHWSNVYNAENARKISAYLRSRAPESAGERRRAPESDKAQRHEAMKDERLVRDTLHVIRGEMQLVKCSGSFEEAFDYARSAQHKIDLVTAAFNRLMASRASVAAPEWQDIATAPRDGREILAYWDKGNTYTIIYWHRGYWHDAADDSAINAPTHWHPLIAAPKDTP